MATLNASGRYEQQELPNFAQQRAIFDASLAAEPVVASVVDTEEMQLRRALGVAG